MSKHAAPTWSLVESAFASSSNHPPCTGRIIEQGNEKVKRFLPHFSMETISSSGHDKRKDLNLKDEVDIKLSGKKYTQTLPLLSRLTHRSTLPLVDVSRLKEDSCPSDEQSRHLSLPVCVSEATSSCHAKFSEDQNILATQNRSSQHLLQFSDHLSLSLGLCSSNQSFDDLFGAPFSAIDTQTPPSEEYDNIKLTASKRLKATEGLNSQLTIFYAGKVHIYHDVPEDKAKTIMLLAENGTRQENLYFATQNPGCISSTIYQHCPSSSAHDAPDTTLPQTSHDAGRSSASVILSFQALSKLQPAGNIPYSALPQHRRMSLQRFLQKRTERSARAAASPYIANKNNVESGSTLPRSRPSSPVLLNGAGSRASNPAAFLGGSECRTSPSCGDYSITST